MAKYKLTYYNVLGIAEPIRYMFAIAGVPYEDNRIPWDDTTYPVLPKEIKDKLPWGNIPILEFDGKTIGQSTAIGRFLARKFDLVGADDYEAAKCDEYCDALRDFGKEWHSLGSEQDPEKKVELLKKLKEVTIPKFMGKFESIITENGGKWLVGSKVTWADLGLAYSIRMLGIRSKINLCEGYPAVEAHDKAVHDIPQIKEWIANRPQTD